MKNVSNIYGHRVIWWTTSKSLKELQDIDETYIKDRIADGYTGGELCISYTGANGHYYEAQGRWYIPDWQDIACELYHAVSSTTEGAQKARKRFNDNWA